MRCAPDQRAVLGCLTASEKVCVELWSSGSIQMGISSSRER